MSEGKCNTCKDIKDVIAVEKIEDFIKEIHDKDVQIILNKATRTMKVNAVSSLQIDDSKLCGYSCNETMCDFKEVIAWIDNFEHPVLSDLVNDEQKHQIAQKIADKVNDSFEIVKPHKYRGFYFHLLDAPLLFIHNDSAELTTTTISSVNVDMLFSQLKTRVRFKKVVRMISKSVCVGLIGGACYMATKKKFPAAAALGGIGLAAAFASQYA
jgi:hypothetical protein